MNTVPQELQAVADDFDPEPISPDLVRLAALSPRPTTLAQTGLSLTFLADLLGTTGQFGSLTTLDGFPTDSYLAWIVPLSCMQGAG